MNSGNKWKNRIYSNKGRTLIDCGIIAFFAVIIFRNFIFSSGWPSGGDTLGWISREYLFGHDFRWLHIWHPYSFGFVEGINSIDFFFMLINLVFQNGAVTVKVFMFSTFIVAGFSMYGFAYHYTRNNLAALCAALVYTLNQWFFTQFTEGHLGILFGYALAPLLFLLLTRALKFGKIKDLTLFACGLTICLTGFNALSFVIYMFFLMLFIIVYLITPQNNFQFWNRTKRAFKVLMLSGIIFLSLSAFYILPFLNNARAPFYSSEFSYNVEESVIHSYENMLDAFVLRGVEHWGYLNIVDVTSEMSLQSIPVELIVFLIFLIAYSTVSVKTDRYTIFFFVSCLVSIFLAKGPSPPNESIFMWAWFNIPHFAVFRAASRFSMMTALSNAFFISVLVTILTGYIAKTRNPKKIETQLEISIKNSEKNTDKQTVSFKPLNLFFTKFTKFLHYSSKLLLILIILSGFFSCWFFFQNGLQVYDAPENLMTPYNWIANQPDEFKIVTVTRSPSEWELASDALTDYGSGGMLTSIGWGHDIGHDSAFIHDKPVLQDGGHTFKSRQLVSYLRFGVARKQLSDQLMSLLGTFDYKYIVLPDYASENIKTFFISQEGTKVVYNQSDNIILENINHNERIFSTTEYTIIVGGFKSFFSTSKIKSFNFNQNTFLFADQYENSNIFGESALENSGAILFDDSDLLDLVMLSSDDMNVIRAEQFALPSSNYSAYWGKSTPWEDQGVLAMGRYTVTTSGKNKVTIPFEVTENGDYEILIHLGFGNDRGKLAVHVDNIPITRLYPNADARTTLKWVNIDSLKLEKGKHEISFTNDGTGWNDIDAVAVVESSILEKQTKKIINQIQDYPGRLIHILSAFHTFSNQIPRGWYLTSVPYQGYVLETDSPLLALATNVTILRDGKYMFSICLAQEPNQGSPQLQVDNSTCDLRLISSNEKTQWYEAGPVFLNSSNHLVEIGASGKIAFDQLVIYSLEKDETSTILNELQVQTTEFGLNVSPKGKVYASSFEGDESSKLKETMANDGNLETRWASNPQNKTMPQWLQLDWETSQELTGVQVFFEQAYPKDYVIQSWNGTNWIEQINITDNSLLERFHNFTEPVNTQKLRIYMTSAPAYDMVSVWEFQAYTKPTVTKRVVIPQDGTYRVTLQLATGPEYGILKVIIDDKTTTISCNSANTETKLYETQPTYLKSGEQKITVSATGTTDLKELTLALNDDGDSGFLDDLFQAKIGPNISYSQINSGKYEAHIENNNEPFLLVFSESYHPMWKAYINDMEIASIPIYDIVNGFYINKTGTFTVTIYFTGQTYADTGIQITLISIVIISPILIIPSKKLEKIGNYIKQKSHRQKPQKEAQLEGGHPPLE